MLNSMDINTVVENERNKGKYEIKKMDGKTAFVFDSAPALIYISENGDVGRESIFINGKEGLNVKAIKLDSKAGELLTFDVEYYGIGMDAGKDVFSAKRDADNVIPELMRHITVNLGITPSEASKFNINEMINQISKALEKSV